MRILNLFYPHSTGFFKYSPHFLDFFYVFVELFFLYFIVVLYSTLTIVGNLRCLTESNTHWKLVRIIVVQGLIGQIPHTPAVPPTGYPGGCGRMAQLTDTANGG